MLLSLNLCNNGHKWPLIGQNLIFYNRSSAVKETSVRVSLASLIETGSHKANGTLVRSSGANGTSSWQEGRGNPGNEENKTKKVKEKTKPNHQCAHIFTTSSNLQLDSRTLDLMDEYWFISDDGKVIVEPPKHCRTGKYKGYVWVIAEAFRKKKHRKQEVIISHDFFWIQLITSTGLKVIFLERTC